MLPPGTPGTSGEIAFFVELFPDPLPPPGSVRAGEMFI
jgi:hypothetical protein